MNNYNVALTIDQKQILDTALSTLIWSIKKTILDNKGDWTLESFVSEQQKKLEEATVLRDQLRFWSRTEGYRIDFFAGSKQ